jgi:glutamate dehydrogenase/leucine dehydrogenase
MPEVSPPVRLRWLRAPEKFWSAAEVEKRLEDIMVNFFRSANAAAKEYGQETNLSRERISLVSKRLPTR